MRGVPEENRIEPLLQCLFGHLSIEPEHSSAGKRQGHSWTLPSCPVK